MKALVCSVFLVAIIVAAVTITACKSGGRPASPRPVAAAAGPAATLDIQKALYGDLPGGTSIDVTEKARSFVRNGSLETAASDSLFGDPYNGKVELQIVRALAHVKNLNLGGPEGAGDVTDRIKQFQDGNHFYMKIDGDTKITVDYRFGQGELARAVPNAAGEVRIDPPTRLRVDYTYNGTPGCRIFELVP